MRTAAELVSKWEARHDEWRRLGIQVDGAALAVELRAITAELAQ